jgi:hypothetical protein
VCLQPRSSDAFTAFRTSCAGTQFESAPGRKLGGDPQGRWCKSNGRLTHNSVTAFGRDEVVTGIGQTGVVGVIRGQRGAGKSIGLRADMDALPILEANDRNAPSSFIATGKTATFVARTGISGRPSWPTHTDEVFGTHTSRGALRATACALLAGAGKGRPFWLRPGAGLATAIVCLRRGDLRHVGRRSGHRGR